MNKEINVGITKWTTQEVNILDKEHKHTLFWQSSLNLVWVCFVYWFCNSSAIPHPKVDSKSYFLREI